MDADKRKKLVRDDVEAKRRRRVLTKKSRAREMAWLVRLEQKWEDAKPSDRILQELVKRIRGER